MTVEIIPAIDLKGGRCVRLRQGRMEDETVFSDNPAEVARRWEDAGASRIHLVDLDGAVGGAPVNAPRGRGDRGGGRASRPSSAAASARARRWSSTAASACGA